LWKIKTETEIIETQYFAYSYSPLHHPLIPKEVQLFKGPKFHTSQWKQKHDIFLENKRIGIIGNAASGIQIIPYLAQKASHLYIFQRTPNWILPKGNRHYTMVEKWLFGFSWIQKIYRNYLYWSRELFFTYFYQNMYGRKILEWVLKKIYKDVPDYPLGCKRILLSDEYYKTLSRENVSIIPIEKMEMTKDSLQKISLDLIILATGFDLQGSVKHVRIIGEQNTFLDQVWNPENNEYFKSFLGIYVDNFPNMFVLLGPNTGSAHTSIILYIEAQCENIIKAIQWVEKNDKKSIVVSSERVEEYLRWMDGRFPLFVWNQCNSWYLSKNKNVSLFPGFHWYYQWILQNHQFKGFSLR
jgi:cyclohexanone monooxygenase